MCPSVGGIILMESNGLWHDDQEYLLTLQVQYLNDLLDNMNEIFYTYNTDGIMTYVNKKIKDILGYEQKELVGKCMGDRSSDYKELLMKETKKRLQKGKGKREIHLAKVVRKDGATRIIRINVAPIEENGKIIGEAVLAEDVTEAKQNEKALRDSNQLLQDTKNELMEANDSLRRAKEELRRQLEESEQHKEAVTTAHHKLENIMDFLPDPTML
jgi:PAS domain S-box-containing protein